MKLLPKLSIKKKIYLGCTIVLLAVLIFVVATHFVYSVNQGRIVGDPFQYIDTPTDEEIFELFSKEEICWKFAFWSVMVCEFSYTKEGYPNYNATFAALGFDTSRFHTYFTRRGEEFDDLMVDAGVRIIESDEREYTLVAIAFRGAIPLEMNSPTTVQNFRRSLRFLSTPWRESGRVHRGFYAQYNDFLNYVLPEIQSHFDLDIFDENPSSQIKFWIIGYSMGAALAELFTLELATSGIIPSNIITFGFAAPNVGNSRLQAYAYELGVTKRIFRINHRRDIVGHLGFGVFFGSSLAAQENTFFFGSSGLFTINHHSLTRIYLPFIISQNPEPLRSQMEAGLVVEDM